MNLNEFNTLGCQERTRLTACLSGAFCPFRLDGLRHICDSKTKNHSKIQSCQVHSSFAGAEKRSCNEKPAGNTLCIAKGFEEAWAFFCPSKPCVALSIEGNFKF